MHLRKKMFFLSPVNKIYLTIILIVINVLFIFNVLKNKIVNIISIYAENEIKNISMMAINDAIYNNKYLFNDNNFINSTLNDNEIVSVSVNPEILNDISVNINKDIINNLKNVNSFHNINNNQYIYYVPFGIINSNPLLTDLGPKIAIKATYDGSLFMNTKTSVTPYGINNSLLKVYLDVSISVSLVMPFVIKNININNEIPVIVKIINGKVPSVYASVYNPLNDIKSVIE